MTLHFTWQCLPYVACIIALVMLGVTVAALRGDRVMRVGMLGAVTTTLPWAVCSFLVACTDDRAIAAHLLRMGNGPVALIGPNLLLVLLAVTGQLERQRWLARLAGLVGATMCGLCWATPWIVPDVHPLASGMYYLSGGPLTPLHVMQLAIWLLVGLMIARRNATTAEKRRLSHLILGILFGGMLSAGDMLLVYDVWGSMPLAWIPCVGACVLGMYLVLRADLLRAQGIDRKSLLETGALLLVLPLVGWLTTVMAGATSIALVLVSSGVWVVAIGIAWAVAARTDPAQAGTLSLGPASELASALADETDVGAIAAVIAAAWAPFGIDELRIDRAALPADAAATLVAAAGPIAANDLGTMRLGAARARIEALFADGGATTLIVPLVDREALLGIARAKHAATLRDSQRGIVIEGARAAARALAFADLARAAEAQGETVREVEVAQAMRMQASSSARQLADSLGQWSIAADYRSAPRTTGAGWSSALLADGRLALLVTEAQAHGVPAALATAALAGAFAAATAIRRADAGGAGADVTAARTTTRSGTGVIAAKRPSRPLAEPAAEPTRPTPIPAEPTRPTPIPAEPTRPTPIEPTRPTPTEPITPTPGPTTRPMTAAPEPARLTVDDLLAALRASAEGIVRGGEPVAAFVAILGDGTIEWASAGHAGGMLMSEAAVAAIHEPTIASGTFGSEPSRRVKATVLGGSRSAEARLGAGMAERDRATRGSRALPADAILVVASSELRGEDEMRWQLRLWEVAGAGSRMATQLVEKAADRGAPVEDLLAVVVRARPG